MFYIVYLYRSSFFNIQIFKQLNTETKERDRDILI